MLACNPANRLVKEQCLPTEQGEHTLGQGGGGGDTIYSWRICAAIRSDRFTDLVGLVDVII
jgi:hypothetical protein